MSDLTPTLPTAPLEPPPNRLSILHLMGWTLGSAVILAIWRLVESFQPQPESHGWFRVTQQLLGSLIYGAAVGSLVLVVSRRLHRGPRFPNQPGHWLLVTLGIGVLMSWLLWELMFGRFERRFIGDGYDYVFFQVISASVFAVLYLLAMAANMHPRRWMIFFGLQLWLSVIRQLIAINELMRVVDFDLFTLEQMLATPIASAFLLSVIILDVRRQVSRDYLHWAGIASWFAWQCMHLFTFLYLRIF